MGRAAITLQDGADLEGFRHATRRLIAAGVSPPDVVWESVSAPSLFDGDAGHGSVPVALPGEAQAIIGLVVCHRDPERYGLLYELIWRLRHGEDALLDIASDPLVFRLMRMEKAIRRDIHKMHAFVRFRAVPQEAGERPAGERSAGERPAGERYVAWFEPEHYILEKAAPFFVERFPSFAWSISTPVGSLLWDGSRLVHGPPGRKEDAPAVDGFEAGWARYYASTFNPARVNVAQMHKEMPKKYWRNMPETQLIPDLLRSAGSRVHQIMKAQPAPSRKRDPVKALAALETESIRTLADLNAVISAAEPYVSGGTRAVLGEGQLHPALAFVGEQPGDQEDLQGRPFVGPAGELLNRAMAEAGIRRGAAYVTNAVKHFKFEQRGKRRLHQKPTAGEVSHYRWWLEKELEIVAPKLVVALGATAALALTGKTPPVTKFRGPISFDGKDGRGMQGFITVHPSYLLRIPDADAKREAYDAFVADLKAANRLAQQATRAA